MSHDTFESERYRVERVLEILEHAVDWLGARVHVSVSLLKDAVAFLRGAEEAAYEAAQEDDSEPTLSGSGWNTTQPPGGYWRPCTRHFGTSNSATQMPPCGSPGRRASISSWIGETICASTIDCLRERKYAAARWMDRRASGIGRAYKTDTNALDDCLVEAAAILGLGVPSAFPTARARGSK